jgi:hypothetical protein
MEKLYTYLGWGVLFTLIFAIANILSQINYIYLLPDSWGLSFARHGQEGFENPGKEVKGVVEPSAGDPDSADAPYSPLADVLKLKGTEGTLDAKSCFETDFLAQTEKTGNYIQRTNNFRHVTPDSCSAPRTELVNAFYMN